MGRLVSYPLGLKPNLYLLLILGMLPDIDLLLGVLGVQHRTFTHSVVFWSIAFAPFFAKYRITALPYFAAPIQHIMIGDLVVGRTDILWPTEFRIGLGLPILSPISLALEGIGLAVFVALLVLGRGRDEFFAPKKVSWLLIPVTVPLAGFVILVTLGGPVVSILLEHTEARHLERNIPSILNSGYVQIAAAMHLALLAIILVPVFRISKSASGKLQWGARGDSLMR
ncbi:MAG TPA: hypothetical protein VLA68_04145 [Nitrososphaera sp.]|nr:hypothetical protein [Nitrososphaera sp.]